MQISRENQNKKEKTAVITAVLLLCRHRLIFPGRFQPSIVSTDELNYRVRDGNGWTLIAKNTDLRLRYSVFVSFSLAIIHAQGEFVNSYFDNFCKFFQNLSDKRKNRSYYCSSLYCVGIALSSRAASSQVLSALMSLTTVFGMGTGGPSSLKTPTYAYGIPYSFHSVLVLYTK